MASSGASDSSKPMTAVMLANHRRIAPFGVGGRRRRRDGAQLDRTCERRQGRIRRNLCHRRRERRRDRDRDARRRRIRQSMSDKPAMPPARVREHRGHRARVLRLRGVQHARRAGVQQAVLPDRSIRSPGPCWRLPRLPWVMLSRPFGGMLFGHLGDRLRTPLRAGDDAHHDGHHHRAHRPAADLCADRRARARAAGDVALPAGHGARRRMGRRGVAVAGAWRGRGNAAAMRRLRRWVRPSARCSPTGVDRAHL